MGGDHASLRFGDVTCCVVSGQALLRFLEARRRVLYVNEYNTSQFCHVCDQRVRQVSNRQVSLSTHPLARLLPHTLLQLEMQAAAASMTLNPPPPYVCPGTAGREKVCDHCNPNVPINRDLNAAKNMEKIFLAYLKTRERPEHLRWPSYKPANTCDAASDGPLPVVAPQAASRPPTGTASAPSPAAQSATQARARGKATPKRPAGSEQTTISSAAGQSKRVKQVGRGR